MAELTEKQRRFAEAYLSNGGNAADAYRSAYGGKASPATASKEGQKLLRHPLIAPLVAKANQKAEAATERVIERFAVTKERVLLEVARIAFADARKLFKWGADGVTVRESEDLSDDEAAAVSEVSQTVTEHGGTIRVKMANKLEALGKLGQNLSLWDAQPPPDGAIDDMANDPDPPRVDRGKTP